MLLCSFKAELMIFLRSAGLRSASSSFEFSAFFFLIASSASSAPSPSSSWCPSSAGPTPSSSLLLKLLQHSWQESQNLPPQGRRLVVPTSCCFRPQSLRWCPEIMEWSGPAKIWESWLSLPKQKREKVDQQIAINVAKYFPITGSNLFFWSVIFQPLWIKISMPKTAYYGKSCWKIFAGCNQAPQLQPVPVLQRQSFPSQEAHAETFGREAFQMQPM